MLTWLFCLSSDFQQASKENAPELTEAVVPEHKTSGDRNGGWRRKTGGRRRSPPMTPRDDSAAQSNRHNDQKHADHPFHSVISFIVAFS